MAKSKQYIRKHTNEIAFKKHKAGLKKRGAVIEKIDGMTIYYHFKD
jgi:hypothetical protein